MFASPHCGHRKFRVGAWIGAHTDCIDFRHCENLSGIGAVFGDAESRGGLARRLAVQIAKSHNGDFTHLSQRRQMLGARHLPATD
jgi:hypothetical protein